MNKRKEGMTENFKKIISILTAAAVILGSLWIPGAGYAQTASAISITLKKTQGSDILVTTASNRKLSPRNNMKLYSGYRISTGVKSFAYMALDEKKAVKTGELSRVEIKKEGRKNEIKVICGKLFFNVKEKLSDKETMTISTSNLSMGIRGTSGSVSLEPVLDEQGNIETFSQTVQIYDGSVELTVSGTEKKAVLVRAGEEATLTSGTDGGASVAKKTISPSDIPSFAGDEMLSDKALFARVEEGTGFTAREVKSGMESSRLEEEKATGQLINLWENNRTEEPDYSDEVLFSNEGTGNTGGSDSNSSGGGDNSGGNWATPDPGPTFTPDLPPAPTPTPVPTPAPSGSSVELNLDNCSDADLLTRIEAELEDSTDINLSSSHERTIRIDRQIVIGTSQTVTIGKKLTFLIVEGGDLSNAGTLINKGKIKVEGGALSNSLDLYNDTAGEIENNGRITNSGSFENKGSFLMNDAASEMTNSGLITNQGGDMQFLNGTVVNNSGTIQSSGGTFSNSELIENINGGEILL